MRAENCSCCRGFGKGVIECPGVPSLGQVWHLLCTSRGFDDDLEANNNAHEPPESDVGDGKGVFIQNPDDDFARVFVRKIEC
jgi:hypothetical protein